MDHVLEKLEKYATDLESIVASRTSELVGEKRKTDMLLNRMLPPYVYWWLLWVQTVCIEHYI